MRPREHLHQAIVSGNAAVALADIQPHPGLTPHKQLQIYIDGYQLRLHDAVASDYPCLKDYLGLTVIKPLIDAYIAATPSRSYNLDFYSFGFGNFVASQNVPAAAASLALFEGAIAETFMLPDSPALTPDAFTQSDVASLGQTRFSLRRALQLLELRYDAETCWRQHKLGITPLPDPQSGQNFFCICRALHDVKCYRLEPTAFHLLQTLAEGHSLDQAIALVLNQGDCTATALSQSIGSWLGSWVTAGFFQKSEA